MSPFHILNALTCYFEIAILLSFSAVVLCCLNYGAQNSDLNIRFEELHKISKFFVIASIFLPLVLLTVPKNSLMRPHAQVFSSGEAKTAKTEALIGFNPAPNHPSSERWIPHLIIEKKQLVFLLTLLFSGCAVQIGLFARRMRRLTRLLHDSQLIKSIGTTKLLASMEVSSPFAFWNWGTKTVVLPTDFLSRREDFKIALQHEFQHLRNGDTRMVFWLELLKVLFFWNPFTFLLITQTHLVQEFACDEFLIGHQKISPHAYGGCLVRTAESAVFSQPMLVGTAGMAGNQGGSILKRRIQMLFKTRKETSKTAVALVSAITFGLMASFAYASKSAIQERKITMREARTYAEKAAAGSQIPIDLNEAVLAKLNYFVGTAHGRSWAKMGLERMKIYEKMIGTKITQLGLPPELIAIPLYESAFQNDVVSPPPYRAAGIWQFIASTAQHYNLTVDEKTDERLNPEKETEAAMKYFSNLKDDFHDWRLAIKSYNEGEHQVQKLIDQLGTKDPWVLEHASSSEGYLSGAIAMMIVMKNPELLN
jgi:beta-lactamase regulating signal transducer with metallopeptidase domain